METGDCIFYYYNAKCLPDNINVSYTKEVFFARGQGFKLCFRKHGTFLHKSLKKLKKYFNIFSKFLYFKLSSKMQSFSEIILASDK